MAAAPGPSRYPNCTTVTQMSPGLRGEPFDPRFSMSSWRARAETDLFHDVGHAVNCLSTAG